MLLTTKLMTNNMNIDQYGEFRLIFTVSSFLSLFLILGRDSCILKIANKNNNSSVLSEFFFGLVTVYISVLFLFLFSEFFIDFLFDGTISSENYGFGLIMISAWATYNLLTPLLRINNKQNIVFICNNFLLRALRLPLFIFFVYWGFLDSSAYYAMISSQVILLIIVIWLVWKNNIIKDLNISLKGYFTNFFVSLNICVNTILFTLLTTVTTLYTAKILSVSGVAVADLVIMLLTMMIFPFLAYVKSVEPFLSLPVEMQSADIIAKINNTKAAGFLLSFVSTMFLCLFSEYILLIFGKEYSVGGTVALTYSANLFFISIMFGPFPEWLNMNGRSRLTTYILVVTLIYSTFVLYIFLPRYNILGVGLGLGSSLILYRVLCFVCVFKYDKNCIRHYIFPTRCYLFSFPILFTTNAFIINEGLLIKIIWFFVIATIMLLFSVRSLVRVKCENFN